MGKNKPDWHVPSDWKFLGMFQLIVPAIAILAALLLPVLSRLKTADLIHLYITAVCIAGSGIVLLFFARLPLYRQKKFFTFGPKLLPALHRKIYWTAYGVVVLAVLLFGIVWLRGA